MNLGFKIPEEGSLDLLSLGALVHRLDPGIIPFRKATNFAVHVSAASSMLPPTCPTPSGCRPA